MKNIVVFVAFISVMPLAYGAGPNDPLTADVSILKARVAPFKAAIQAGTAAASQLKLVIRGANHGIGYDECKDIQKKIEAQYPLSPFYAVYKDGASFTQFCDWDIEHPSKTESVDNTKMTYFFDSVQTENQMGVSASSLVKIVKPVLTFGDKIEKSIELEFLLDSNFKIIECNTREIFYNGDLSGWDVMTFNDRGDQFYFIGSGKDGSAGDIQRAFFASGDGLLSGFYGKVPRRSDRGNEKIISQSFQVNQKDWLDSTLLPMSEFGHLVQYVAGEWLTFNKTYDVLYEVQLADSGVEVCADGSTEVNGDYTHYLPSNNQDPWSCSNAW